MKTNLSSQIKLDIIPRRYFDAESDLDLTALAREEKIYTRIFEHAEEGADYLSGHIVRVINKTLEDKSRINIAMGAGQSTAPVYASLIKKYQAGEVSFDKVHVYMLSEFFPEGDKGSPSMLNRLKTLFLDHVNIPVANIHAIDTGIKEEDVYHYCRKYEDSIENDGGLDLTILEIGPDGMLAYNEPGSLSTSRCRLVLLSGETRRAVRKEFNSDSVPATAITLGLGNIMQSMRVMAMAWGEIRDTAVKNVIEGPVTVDVPGSIIQLHNHARIALDLSAAEKLTRLSYPWKVTSCEWTPKLIRRAIVWLCKQTGKPILKLTDKDYNDWGLGELLAHFGSAYNVNIRVFNELQHTITGWPGGKANTDDSSRPERATPYPKRVIVFSPHPDDDVISMGGTLKRLVDQNHEVHVAYETSGNIAVGNEDMSRYFLVMDRLAPQFGFDTEGYRELSRKVDETFAKSSANEPDSLDVREIKTMIRQAEASIACRYVGVHPDRIHFLRLPFYETGAIKKSDLSEKDVEIVKGLLQKIKPHQIFVAGDLADPHGTHKVCTDAVLAAVDELKDEPWIKDCRIWMYRGAWAEWEIDHIEMAVPISPEELRAKRNSILKHQSQMENAPFLGDDDRLFWQRAEERNRATAQLYEQLGLASYEAMEAFVRYIPQ